MELYECRNYVYVIMKILIFYIFLNWKSAVLGSQRANIICKLLRNGSGLILESFGIDLGWFFNLKVTILDMFLNMNSPNEKNMTIQSQISSSSNKSRLETCFKMCSRSRQYQRFEYHQKLLSQKWSYG